MGNSAKEILAKYEHESKERAESGNVYALKDSEGKFLRNKRTRFLIKRIKNPIFETIARIIMFTVGITLVAWTVFLINTYFQDF